jgi:hypothetical protein
VRSYYCAVIVEVGSNMRVVFCVIRAVPYYQEMEQIFQSLTSHYRKLVLHTPSPAPPGGFTPSPAPQKVLSALASPPENCSTDSTDKASTVSFKEGPSPASDKHSTEKPGLTKRSGSFKLANGPLSLDEEQAKMLAENPTARAVMARMGQKQANPADSSISSSSLEITQPQPIATRAPPAVSYERIPVISPPHPLALPGSSVMSPSGSYGDESPVFTPNTTRTLYACYSDLPSVLRFHTLADEYVNGLIAIQTFVQAKQKEIVREGGAKEAKKANADDAAGRGKQYPHWLAVLIDKYNSLVSSAAAAPIVIATRSDGGNTADSPVPIAPDNNGNTALMR